MSKEPKSLVPADPMRLTPAWRISKLEMVDPFGWHRIEAAKLEEVRQKLAHFEAMTWQEILVSSGHRNHAVAIDRICDVAVDRLEEIGQGDTEELVSLRLSGPERVWGIRTGNVFMVLWWDPEHAVCPALLRHT
ncbi:MAG TPA: hypothetical protein VFE33_33760 [Thermoanaerobaculia bacterium]|nr:hypothetical protein [Thermoanaerobaculia bacterium]